MWESLLLSLISEQFEEPRVIGMALSLRTKERLLEVWLKDGRNEKVRTNVSNKLRQSLNLDPENVTLYYKEHQKSIKDQSTMKNAEGFKFMKGGARGPQQQKSPGNGLAVPHSLATSYQPKEHPLQPWSGLSSSAEADETRQQTGPAYRKKSGAAEQQNHPFSHLGAQSQSSKHYRVKAPSHI